MDSHLRMGSKFWGGFLPVSKRLSSPSSSPSPSPYLESYLLNRSTEMVEGFLLSRGTEPSTVMLGLWRSWGDKALPTDSVSIKSCSLRWFSVELLLRVVSLEILEQFSSAVGRNFPSLPLFLVFACLERDSYFIFFLLKRF